MGTFLIYRSEHKIAFLSWNDTKDRFYKSYFITHSFSFSAYSKLTVPMTVFYNNIVGSQISLLQILHSSFGLVGIFFLMIKRCHESMWSSLHFCPVSFVWIISPSFCCHNSLCSTESQLAVEQAWHHQQLLGQSPENLGYTQNLTEREKSHNFSLRAKCSSGCGICLQISSLEESNLHCCSMALITIYICLQKGLKGLPQPESGHGNLAATTAKFPRDQDSEPLLRWTTVYLL